MPAAAAEGTPAPGLKAKPRAATVESKKKAEPRAPATTAPGRAVGRPVMDPDAPEDIREAVSRLKTERIVAAAVELFYNRGYSNTTLEQVAESLNVTKPFIYSHFKSKNELLAEICGRAIRISHEVLNRTVAEYRTPTEKLEALARDFMLTVLNHQAHAVIYSREEKELHEEDREAINVMRRQFDRRFAALLEEGVSAGEFTVDDVPLAALAIGGIVGWAPVWFRSSGRLTKEEAAERIAALVLAMVRAKTPKRRRARAADPAA